jgi:flagellar M-ring protein FliF
VNNIFAMLAATFARYTIGQRMMMVTVGIGMLSAVLSLVIWANQPEYEALYANLEPAVASQMVSELRAQKVKFKIEDNGRTILVPRDQVAELRLSLTEAGYAGKTVSGYEIFDDAKIGMTTFMQRLNMRRALEGELVKTINQFPEVKSSRVHLVLPEEELFAEDRKGSASVVVHLTPGRYMKESQVKGITALVANSVKGIEPDKVVVVDSDGNMLTTPADERNLTGSGGSQYEIKTTEEQKMQRKITDIIESIVGPQNAIVRVALDMNFEQIERESETPDPETVVVISEEARNERIASFDSTRFSREERENENILTNYEIGKIRERYVANSGDVKRVSVAVLVNGTYRKVDDGAGNTTREYVPRNRRELDQIASLVRGAIGFDAERGDVVEVQNMVFEKNNLDDDQEYFADLERKEMISDLINKGIIALGIIIAFFLLRSLFKGSVGGGYSAMPVLSTGGGGGQAPALESGESSNVRKIKAPVEDDDEDISEDIYIKKLSPEARAKLKANDKMMNSVTTYAKEEPDAAAKIIRSWLTRGN